MARKKTPITPVSRKKKLKASNEETSSVVLQRTLPPGGGSDVIPPVQQYVGIISSGKRFFLNPDEAILTNPEDAYRMWFDMDIQDPLQSRILATAQLPWHIEPEDKKDPVQVERAKEVQRIMEDIPQFLKMKNALLDAIWFGKAGVQVNYEWKFSREGKKYLGVKAWSPVHGDSIVYKFDSDRVAIMVGPNSFPGEGTDQLTTEPTSYGTAHVLSDWEREAFIIHSHIHQANAYLKIQKAGGTKGVGLRDTVYWTWYTKQETMALLQEYMERVGLGITIWRYDASNEQSLAAVKRVAESQASNMQIFWPWTPDEKSLGGSGIERIEPSSVGMDNFLKIIKDYFGAQLKRYIVGQDLTSESNATGLGSNLASVHQNTFYRLVTFDSVNLQETLTEQLVRIIHKYSFPEDDFKLRLKIAVDKPDPKEYLDAAKAFFEMGGALDEDEVRSVLGFTRPDADSQVLQKQEAMPGAEMGMGEDMGGYMQEEADSLQDPRGAPGEAQPTDEEAADELAGFLQDLYGEMGVGVEIDRDALLKKVKSVNGGEPGPDEENDLGEQPETDQPENDLGEEKPAPAEGGEAGGAEAGGEDVQDTALNGAQISSLLLITDKLAQGLYPVAAAEAIIRASFPALSDQQIKSIIGPLAKAPKKPQENARLKYRLASPPFPGAVFDETKHRWVSKDEASPGSRGGAKKGQTQGQQPKGKVPSDQEAWAEIAPGLKADHPKEMSEAGVAQKAESLAARLKLKVYGYLYRANPFITNLAEAVLDTPSDFVKFGYQPSVSGTSAANTDPLKAHLGISTHLAMSIASKVLAAGLTKLRGGNKKLAAELIAERMMWELAV
jgi:phage gp29-like protein